jgi:uncharacterized protein DUF3800
MQYNSTLESCVSEGPTLGDMVSITEAKRFVMLRVYVDDSADEKQQRVVAAGAYVGFYKQWRALRDKWKRRLKRDGLSYFHTTECYSLRGEFGRFRDPIKYPVPTGRQAADAILHDLEAIIETTQVMGLAVCIPLEMYNEVRSTEQHAAEIFTADAFQVALSSLFKSCAEIARDKFRPQEKLAFVCDISDQSPIITQMYIQFRHNNPGLCQFISSFGHQDDKIFPPLQAADLMAHLARKRFGEYLNDPTKSVFTGNAALKERLKKLNIHKIEAWDRNYMMAVLDSEKKLRGLN